MSFNVAQQTIGYAAGSAASAAISPEVQPLANALWEASPTIPLSPADAAQMVVQAILDEDSAAKEAAQSGISEPRFRNLVRLSGEPPGPETLLELWDRNVITEQDVTRGLQQSRLKPEWVEHYKKLQRTLLTAGQLAEMVVQGVVPEDAATTMARQVSIEPEDFQRMIRLAGSPPGPHEMLDLWNRGDVAESDVDRALLQSRLKPEWVSPFKRLRRNILSPATAAELVLKQRIPLEQGLRIAAENGVSPDDFQLMADVNGRPIGTLQALQLARRGEFTRQQFEEVVARSDVRTQYADDLWKLRRVLPRLGTVTRLVTSGALTEDVAIRYIVELGYDREIASGLVVAAKHGKTQHTRDLSASMIDTLYESGLETRQWAIDALTALGYDAEEADWHLMLLDARRLLAALQSNLTLIHRMYVGHKYDRTTATNHLDAMQLNPDVRNQLLETWDHERAANVTRLTNAQIGSALKKGVITRDDAITRWKENGYPDADAGILAELAQKGGHPASPTAP